LPGFHDGIPKDWIVPELFDQMDAFLGRMHYKIVGSCAGLRRISGVASSDKRDACEPSIIKLRRGLVEMTGFRKVTDGKDEINIRIVMPSVGAAYFQSDSCL
jgi:hypothetical protein